MALRDYFQPGIKFTYEAVDQINRVFAAVVEDIRMNDYCLVCEGNATTHNKGCPIPVWQDGQARN